LHPLAFLIKGTLTDSHGSNYGAVMVRRESGHLDAHRATRIFAALKKRFHKEYRLTSARTLPTRTGPVRAYGFTSREGDERWNHLVAPIPARGHSYIFDGLYERGAGTARQQIIATLRSFKST
jgi:hypothetical protein